MRLSRNKLCRDPCRKDTSEVALVLDTLRCVQDITGETSWGLHRRAASGKVIFWLGSRPALSRRSSERKSPSLNRGSVNGLCKTIHSKRFAS